MLPSWCDDTVTVLRAPTVTRNGRSVRDWANATSHELARCTLQPSTTETGFDGAQRNAAGSSATLICPHGSDVREGDRVSFGGRTWEVDGVPLGTRSPTGHVSNVRVMLREWRG